MKTLKEFSNGLDVIPAVTSWYLADIGEAKGRQELFIKQSPQRLNRLREHALVESAVSSNRIEGVEVEHKRIGTIVFGHRHLQDRSEEEVRGYREALDLIHSQGRKLAVTEAHIQVLHRLTRGEIWDAGQYKENDSDIIEKHADGRSSIRFKTVPASETPAGMQQLIPFWQAGMQERRVHPLILMAAFNLDFLCIHPFRDGNGRVSRLLLLLMGYHAGLEVGRYISIERLIEQNKERYYETLHQSSQGWHDGRHDPWPYINYVCFILKDTYREFEQRLGLIKSPCGEKTGTVISAVENAQKRFSVADLQKACPHVSLDMIRRVLKDMQEAGRIQCIARGKHALWEKT